MAAGETTTTATTAVTGTWVSGCADLGAGRGAGETVFAVRVREGGTIAGMIQERLMYVWDLSCPVLAAAAPSGHAAVLCCKSMSLRGGSTGL
jgi:hypothetical protein